MRRIYGVKTATYHDEAAFYCESYTDAFRLSETVNEWQCEANAREPQDFIVTKYLLEEGEKDVD